jgi:hypothetical protein
MRAIAGAIVMFSGALLWSAATVSYSLLFMAKTGNRHPAELATWGGIAIVAVGLMITLAGFRADRPK